MYLSLILILSSLLSEYHIVSSFVVSQTARKNSHDLVILTATTATPLMDLPSTVAAKEKLLNVCYRLKEENGLFLFDKKAKEDLQNAVSELESISEPPEFDDDETILLGDWTLVCTTSTKTPGIDTSSFPASFLQQGLLGEIRNAVRKTTNRYLQVQQRIRAEENATTIDRVDHVLEYNPPEQLQDVLDNLPEQLTSLNINPLHVSKSKLILMHKASVDDKDKAKVKLALSGIVLNVAGTSTFLEPTGKDVAGINIPMFGEFANSGSFTTTYVDQDLRVSRGKQALDEQLRVFVRSSSKPEEEAAVAVEPEVVTDDEDLPDFGYVPVE